MRSALLAMGVFLVASDDATGQGKKADANYPLTVTVSRVDPKTGAHVDVFKDVDAAKNVRKDGSVTFRVKSRQATGGMAKGDRIKDAEGVTWDVTRATKGGGATVPFWLCDVTKLP